MFDCGFYVRYTEESLLVKSFFFFNFLESNLRHMEVPRLRVKLELKLLAYATATVM